MKKAVAYLMIIVCVFFLISFDALAYTFRPQWVPQAQFAGYYMAVKKGFYKKAGINIQIKHGEPKIMGIREVISRDTDFATSWLIQAIRLNDRGEKLIHIGQFFQKSSLLLLAKRASGIDSVEKFSGRTLGVWPGDFQIPPKALVRNYKIRNIKIVNQGFTMASFLNDEIDIASAMRYNEYHQVLEAGIKPEELIVFSYFDLGMNLPEDGIYVHEDFYKMHLDTCQKFIRASLEGWKYSLDHKDEATVFMTQLANQTDFKTTPQKQRIMLEEIEKVIDLSSTELKKEDFQTALEVLRATGMIKKDLSYDVFTGKEGIADTQ